MANIVIPDEFKKENLNFNNKNKVDDAIAWMEGELKKTVSLPNADAKRDLQIKKLKQLIGVTEYKDPRESREFKPGDAN